MLLDQRQISNLPHSSRARIIEGPVVSTMPVETGAGRNASASGEESEERKSELTDQSVITLTTSSEDATNSHWDLISCTQVTDRG